MVKFQLEEFSHVIEEITPLLHKHWIEIAHYQDINLEVDTESYLHLENIGALKVFTARDSGDNTLIGYSAFFIRSNMHYKSSLQAIQDVIYIDKERRGFGSQFIDWCDIQLKEMGVQVVYHHIKTKHNWGKMLEAKGYELVDLIYAKRLDKEIE